MGLEKQTLEEVVYEMDAFLIRILMFELAQKEVKKRFPNWCDILKGDAYNEANPINQLHVITRLPGNVTCLEIDPEVCEKARAFNHHVVQGDIDRKSVV